MLLLVLYLVCTWNSFLGSLWLSWFVCYLMNCFLVFPGSFSPGCVENEVTSKLSPGTPVFTYCFWWSHPIDWLEIPPKSWWLSSVFISFLSSPWLMFLLSSLISPPKYLIGILNFVWLKQTCVIKKKKIYLLHSFLSFIKLLPNLDVILYSSSSLFIHSARVQTINKVIWLCL